MTRKRPAVSIERNGWLFINRWEQIINNVKAEIFTPSPPEYLKQLYMLVNYKHYCSITLENSNNFLIKYEEKFNIFYKKFIFAIVFTDCYTYF